MRARVAQRDGGVCSACPSDRGPWPFEQWHADHVVPLVLGGPDTLDNITTLCLGHHRAKSKTDGSRRRHSDATHVVRPYGPPKRPGYLSNAELGARLGLTPSAVSLIRRGKRLPGRQVQMAMVQNLGAQWPSLIYAMADRQKGDRAQWVVYMYKLITAAARDSQS